MRRNDRARRRVLAFGLAVAVHVALVAGLVVGARPEPPYADTQVMTVALLDLPKPKRRPETPRSPPPAVEHPKRPTLASASLQPEVVGDPSGPAASVGEGAALGAAPFGRGLRSGPRLRERCYMAQQTEVEKAACERIMAEFRLKPRLEEQDGAFALAAKRKEAIVNYRKSYRGDDFPGLRCAFGRACKPLPPGPP